MTSPAPPLGPHELATIRWGVRWVLRTVVGLVGGVVFLVLWFGTNLGSSVGVLGLVAICLVPALLLYFPLSWAAWAWVDRRIRERQAGG